MHPQDRVLAILGQPGVESRWWRVPGYQYEINIFGDVRRVGAHAFLRPGVSSKGYAFVELWSHGRRNRLRLHRLVWLSIVGEVPAGMLLNHLDRDRKNPRLSNLELTTAAGNMAHSVHARTESGEACGRRALNSDIPVLVAEATLEGLAAPTIAQALGVSISTVERARAKWYRWFEGA